ncbi:MAG: hypothetical protein MUE62_05240 [Burkholderiaceae bacterium]|nr:hypothetical protein [Burkholderiaceae bacterium]
MYLVPIAWMYVVLMVAIVEATAPNGTWLGALVIMYVLGTPARRRARQAAEAAEAQAAIAASAGAAPDGRDVAAGDAVATERKEP